MYLHELLEPLDLFEAFDTRFDNVLHWEAKGANLEAIGHLDDEQIKVILNPIKYQKYNGVNLVFQVLDHKTNAFSEKIGTSKSSSSRIIGAVQNAFVDKINDFKFDFVVAVAKDNLDSRSKLYSAIFRRAAIKLGLGTAEIKREHFTICGIGKKGDLQEILKNLPF